MSKRHKQLAPTGSVQQQSSLSVQYAGPLPPAGEYERYERTLPGSASRILAMAEKEQAYRHEREPVIQKYQRDLAYRGQWFAAGLSIVFGAAAVYLGMNGHEVIAGILGGSTLIGIVSIFVLRKK
jgi:uncharacterized membrane protein